jgi:hypothetical protein
VRILKGMGIQVFPWVSGDAHQALKGFLAGMILGSDPQGRKVLRPPKNRSDR